MKALNIPVKLATNPTKQPKHTVTITDASNNEVICADPKITRALVLLMNQQAVSNGAAAHWGGPAALAEIMSALHSYMFTKNSGQWFESYNFVNDAGHTENGVYALRANWGYDNLSLEDLRKFRSIESKLTGHGEGHLNPEGVLISNGPLGSGLPQAQGLAMADRLLKNNRKTICVISDGASMEGEAQESFAKIPGLARKERINPFLMIISDNDTKLSGRISEDSYTMNESFESLKTLGWNVIQVNDGHNLQDVYQQIDSACTQLDKNPNQPICLWVKTIKGKGLKNTEESASGGHGHPFKKNDSKFNDAVDEIFSGNTPAEFSEWAKSLISESSSSAKSEPPFGKEEKVQVGIAKALNRAASEGLPVFSLSSDLQGSTGVKGFHQEHPDHYIDLGVSESNMVSAAVGLSKQGLIPVVDTFAQFAITKGNLPTIMSGLSQGPFIGILSHIGFQDAADGASHQATTYISAMASIPHTKVYSLSSSSEAETLLYEVIKDFAQKREKGETPDTSIFFLGRENYPNTYPNQKVSKNAAQILREGKDATIVAWGPMVKNSLLAAEKLQSDYQISIEVINSPQVNSPDLNTIAASVSRNQGRLLTVEDHQAVGGAGQILSHALLLQGEKFELKTLGVDGQFGRSAYSAMELYQLHGLDPESIVNSVREWF